MPTTDTVTIVLRATNDASPTIDETRANLDRLSGSQQRAAAAQAGHTNAVNQGVISQRSLERQMGRLTTAQGLWYESLVRVNTVLLGFAQGAVLGAVAALTFEVFRQATSWNESKEALERYRASLALAREDMRRMGEAASALQRGDLGGARAALEQQADALGGKILELQEQIDVLRESTRRSLAEAGRGGLEGAAASFEILRGTVAANLEEVERLETRVAALQRQREAVVRSIQTVGVNVPKTEAERIAGDIQEQRGRIIQQQAAEEFRLRTEHQENLGRAIAEQAQRQWQEQQELVVAKSRFEIEYAQVVAENEANLHALRFAQAQAATQGQLQLLGTLAGLAASKSRALFLVGKAAAVAQSIVSAYAASNLALANPPGPPATIPLAASVLKWGLANAALAAAVQFATGGFSGGGGGGGLPSGGGGTSLPTSAPASPGSERPPIEITVNYHTMVSDAASKREFIHDVLPLIGEVVRENNGVAGRTRFLLENG